VINTAAVKCEHGALLKAFRCLQMSFTKQCWNVLQKTLVSGVTMNVQNVPRICTPMPGALLLLCFLNHRQQNYFLNTCISKLSIFFCLWKQWEMQKLKKDWKNPSHRIFLAFFWMRSHSHMYVTMEHRGKKTSKYLMWLQHEFMQARIPKL